MKAEEKLAKAINQAYRSILNLISLAFAMVGGILAFAENYKFALVALSLASIFRTLVSNEQVVKEANELKQNEFKKPKPREIV